MVKTSDVRCPSCLNVLGISKTPPDFTVFCDEFCAQDHRLGGLEDRDALIEFLSDWMSAGEIAKEFGDRLSRQAVSSVLRRRRLG